MDHRDHTLMNPRKLSEDEVRLLVADMATKVPCEVTLASALPSLFEVIGAISDRITMVETGNLLGLAAVVSKVVAAQEMFADTQIVVPKETRQ